MFVVAVHVYVKPEAIDEFKQKIRANHEASLEEPGCLRFDVIQDKDDPNRLYFYEVAMWMSSHKHTSPLFFL